MDNRILDNLSMTIGNIIKSDQKDELIYSGDLLIKSSLLTEEVDKAINYAIQNDVSYITGSNVLNECIKYLKSLNDKSINFSLALDYEDIIVAEYFNLEILNNPVLCFHSNFVSFSFDNYYVSEKYKKYYRHLTEKDINEEKTCFLSTKRYVYHDQKVESIIEKLNSIFSKKIKVLKIIKVDEEDCVIFTFKIKDSIAYKKAKKFQKGVFERLNWYKNLEGNQFPFLYYFYKNENLFELALNDFEICKKYISSEKMFNSWIDILYHFERIDKSFRHSDFSIFCKKYKSIDKKIYFYKGRK